jgi:uncharacterized protein with ATP-grasp and redox domains
VNQWLAEPDESAEHLQRLLALAVWGNQADLSMWAAGHGPGGQVETEAQEAHLLVDDSRAVAEHLIERKEPARQVDLVLDNVGPELLADLCLVDFMLSAELAQKVVMHAKLHPTYISDAMIKDVEHQIIRLQQNQGDDARRVGQRLADALERGRLVLTTHPYWTSPLPFWQMPGDLFQQLARSDLILIKGDANYRRLLGDRHWDYTTPIRSVWNYQPAPLAALRVFKSEVAAGLAPGLPEQMQAKDPDWLVDGQWGLVQFVG